MWPMLDYCLARFETEILFPKFKKNSRAAYKNDIMQCLNFLRTQGVEEIRMLTQEHLKNFITFLVGQGIAQTTLTRKMASCKLFLDFCVKEGLTQIRYKGLFKKKFEAPIVHMPSSTAPLALIMTLIQQLGLSVTNIVSLKKDDINFATKEIILRAHKTIKTIKIPTPLCEQLANHCLQQADAVVFAIQQSALVSMIKKSCKVPQTIPSFLQEDSKKAQEACDELRILYHKKHPRA